AWRIAVLGVAAYLLLFILTRAFRPLSARLAELVGRGSERKRLLITGLALVGYYILGALSVLISWLAANALGLLLSPPSAGTAALLAGFVSAFLYVELARLVLSVLFTPSQENFRLFKIQPKHARHWRNWMGLTILFVGYVSLAVVPALEAAGRNGLAELTSWGVAVVAIIFVWRQLWRSRQPVCDALCERAEQTNNNTFSWMLRTLGKTWHWLAILYATGVFIVAVINPGEALVFVAQATVSSALIIGLAVFLSAVLTQWIGKGVHLPATWVARLPLLEQRLNTYVPLLLKILRLVIGIIALMGLSAVWQLGNGFVWLAGERGSALMSTIFDVALILLIALTIWLVAASLIEAKLTDSEKIPSARAQTLLSLFRNAIAIALIVITSMVVLASLGVNIGPLLAGAGVLGLAIGFGAQKLVQDVITGVFIQVENAINTGDFITAGGISGTAERLSIRSVVIRDVSGTVHVVPFSSVDVVSNFTREYAYHRADYGIAYRESVDDAIEQLKAAFDELAQDPEWKDKILEPIDVHGVTSFGDSAVNIRILIKTTAGYQWAVGRAYNRLVKKYFDAAGIEIPFPHTTLYFGVEKDGTAPPAYVRILDNAPKPPSATPVVDNRKADNDKPQDEEEKARRPKPPDEQDQKAPESGER
ncbi:MAG TPA: mechanosensitive ion channel, partial [Halothiobacillus sp.]|nr:mechanosensitive ion channel [Halothiobacillus sp.]